MLAWNVGDMKKNFCLLFVSLLLFNFKIKAVDNTVNSVLDIFKSNYSVVVSDGFVSFKTFSLMKKCITPKNNSRGLLIANIFYNLLKLDFRLEKKYKKDMSYVFDVRVFDFNYGQYFIPQGCIDSYPGPHCIFRRVGFFSFGFGYQKFYKMRSKFSQNILFSLNIVGKRVIPFDFIVSYSPFIFSAKNGFYLNLSLINFSVGNFVKHMIMAFVNINKHVKANWVPNSDDDEDDLKVKTRYICKVAYVQSSGKRKFKFILVDGLIYSLISNINIYIGLKK